MVTDYLTGEVSESCCAPGASWDGQCSKEEGAALYTYEEGLRACKIEADPPPSTPPPPSPSTPPPPSPPPLTCTEIRQKKQPVPLGECALVSVAPPKHRANCEEYYVTAEDGSVATCVISTGGYTGNYHLCLDPAPDDFQDCGDLAFAPTPPASPRPPPLPSLLKQAAAAFAEADPLQAAVAARVEEGVVLGR